MTYLLDCIKKAPQNKSIIKMVADKYLESYEITVPQHELIYELLN